MNKNQFQKLNILMTIVVLVMSILAMCACNNTSAALTTDAASTTDAEESPISDDADVEPYQELPKVVYFGSDANSASDGAIETIRLSATVYPIEAINKKVDWSIEWVSETTEDISDYFVITTEEDGSNIASIECLQIFKGKTAKITVTTRAGGFTASCDVRYGNIPVSLSLSFRQETPHAGSEIINSFTTTEYYNPNAVLQSGTEQRIVYNIVTGTAPSFFVNMIDKFGETVNRTYYDYTIRYEACGEFKAQLYDYQYEPGGGLDQPANIISLGDSCKYSIDMLDIVDFPAATPSHSFAYYCFYAHMENGKCIVRSDEVLSMVDNNVLLPDEQNDPDYAHILVLKYYGPASTADVYLPCVKVTVTENTLGLSDSFYLRTVTEATGVTTSNAVTI